ncbi:pyridoxamine 5'-phosphate oxidase-related, FMN-binding protein [Stanieria cyanosphaera PCC 7437]|uniref:Pyridoxamine 5'-phosphate oxidase-related, FMN-binding protein n=1 Tax=Stanieria cyanosphaera (strain ATCC 29371 / PCC 7437) TaxID=111780 RepID=K9XQ40_STAC7|nr:Npun_F5749 family FMN-dependent PPOX-type flavoprotein [Stanieria cyanosphaera]AFZ34161.1 pyridoxamine 5'-phosphate oxidase-related, FMN-binding protein [Stanieria cyanosphaera PCC 7437]
MFVAPWRSHLARALHLNRSQAHSRYLQLATITPEGLPANRTVVFRGFLEGTNYLQIITDFRSSKIDQIQYQSEAEICWYFTKSREQFRIFGTLILITEQEQDDWLRLARQIAWQKLSSPARLQFAWPNPGQTRESNQEAFSPPAPSELEPLKNFCLLLLMPKKVDHLELKGEPQNRCWYILSQDQSWIIKPVNP